MSVLSLPRTLWTPFQEKSYELDQLKKKAYKLMGEFNSIVLEYRDWFRRKHQSFLDAIKNVQIQASGIVPREISSLEDLRKIYKMGLKLGDRSFRGKEHLQQYFDFWDQLQMLREYSANDLLMEVYGFCRTVEKLRDPSLLEQIEHLQKELETNCTESFDFSKITVEKGALYTYNLSIPDRGFLRLVAFLPFLLQFATKFCFLIGKLFLERL